MRFAGAAGIGGAEAVFQMLGFYLVDTRRHGLGRRWRARGFVLMDVQGGVVVAAQINLRVVFDLLLQRMHFLGGRVVLDLNLHHGRAGVGGRVAIGGVVGGFGGGHGGTLLFAHIQVRGVVGQVAQNVRHHRLQIVVLLRHEQVFAVGFAAAVFTGDRSHVCS